MEYIIVLLCSITILFALYVVVVNIIKRFSYAVNRLFSLIALLTACMVTCVLLPFFIPHINMTELARWYVALIIIINQLFFHYTQIFPRWEKKSPLLIIVISAIPGIITFWLTVTSQGIVYSASFVNGHIQFSYGPNIVVYLVVFLFYILGTFLTLFYKVRRLENYSFRYQLFYVFMGNHVGALIIIISFIIMPYVFQRFEYHSIGISSAALLLLYINNYAISDERYLNFKEFYFRIIYYGIVLLCTVLPTYWILTISYRYFLAGGQIPAVAVAFLNFIYLILFTRVFQPYLDKIIKREYGGLETRFNAYIQALSQTEEFEGDPTYWDRFFATTVDSLEYLFNVTSASFLMYNAQEKALILSHSIGEQLPVKRVSIDDSLVQLCHITKSAIHVSLFYTDEVIRPFDDVREFIKKYAIEVILPCFDSSGKLIGILFIGPHKKGRPYTYNEIQFMELYRVKFSNALSNALQIEEVKAKQIGEHDNLVVSAIKNSILPKQMPYIDRIRLSSLFMNNSNLGGEFFDAKVLHKNSLAFIIADCSYSGVDAAVLALELYGAFESLTPAYDTPEKILQLLNWVVCTSKFTDRYATSFCFTFNSEAMSLKYINAAFNPLILYEIQKDDFLELDTKGIPIGIERDFIYESKEYMVNGPCIGCIYSNGITGAVNQMGQPYSVGRIKDIIRLHNHESPALLIRRVTSDIDTYTANTAVKEDISIIVFRIE